MKKLRDTLENYVVKIDKHWKSLPVERQKFLTKVFFSGYALITVIVIVNICICTGQRSNTISINHIDGISKKPIEKGSTHNEIVNSSTKK
ncbi:hypothetical protein [Chryseobacterium sp. CP-77]|uniref:hypothetical protein n=1 Tax=Chryseobacterium sp. CP-77 TaxID=3116594 RepID=UPI002ED3B9FC